MITLPASIEAERIKRGHSPVLLAEVDLYRPNGGSSYYETIYLSDVGGNTVAGVPGYSFGGHHYAQQIDGDVCINQSKDESIDDVTLELDNRWPNRPWSVLFNGCSINDWVRSKVRIYRTFRGLAERVQVYEGYLEIPSEIGDTFRLESKSLLNGIGTQFPSRVYSQTCSWVTRFGDGTRCNYEGSSTACDGTWATCSTLGMTHRFGGLHVAQLRGSYTYKEQRRFWFDKRKTGTYESEENTGIHGNAIPVPYGKVRVDTDVIWQVDHGKVNCYFGVIGAGPIGGLVDPPDLGRADISNPITLTRNPLPPAVVLNNRRIRDYAFYTGKDGVPGQVLPADWNGRQGIDYLWENQPGKLPYVYTEGTGQTLSRLAYVCGSWPSSEQQNPDAIDELEAYIFGRMVDTYEDSSTAPDIRTDYLASVHDNPAWIWLDILTNRDYGVGLPISLFDLGKMQVAADKCRAEGFTFSHIFREQTDALEDLALVQNSCRGYTAYDNGKFFLVVQTKAEMEAKRAAGSVFTFDNSSINLGSDRYMAGRDEVQSNSIEVPYLDYDQDYQTVPRILEDAENILAMGKKTESRIKFAGVVGFEHANKLAYYHLNRSRLLRREDGCKVVAGDLATIHLQIGDIVKLDLSELDMQDPDNDPAVYDGLYEIAAISWQGNNAEYLLERADSAIFDTEGIAPSVDIIPQRSRNGYPYNIAINEWNLIEGITASESWLDCYWAVPDPPDAITAIPEWVNIYWRKAEDPIYSRIKAGRVKASTGHFKLPLPAELWDQSIVVYFAAESKYGREVPCDPVIDVSLYTYLTSGVSSTAVSWPVNYGASFTAGDLVICWDEVCKVATAGASQITLVDDGSGNREQFERTQAAAHATGDYVGRVTCKAVSIQKKIRDLAKTQWAKNGTWLPFTITAEGPVFIARWNNPYIWLPVRDGESEGAETVTWVPDRYIHHWEICYSPHIDFDPYNDASPDTVWVRDIPGGVHEKNGTDPGKTYYWAMRPVFYNGLALSWQFWQDYSGWEPVNAPVTTRQTATTLKDPTAGTEPLILNDDSELTALNLKGCKVGTKPQNATSARFEMGGDGLKLYAGSTALSVRFDENTGAWWMGDIDGGSTADCISYDPVTKKISAKLNASNLYGGGGGAVIKKEKFTGNGSTTTFTLPALRQSGSDPMVSVNGVMQEPGVGYTLSDGTYTSVTFTFTPASGDVIVVWYQGQ